MLNRKVPGVVVAAVLVSLLAGLAYLAYQAYFVPVVCGSAGRVRSTLEQQMESAPAAREVIAGKYPRMPLRYYELRLHEAQSELQAGELTDSQRSELLTQVAQAHARLGDDSQAVEVMREALSLNPKSASLREQLARYLLFAGDYAAAANQIITLHERHPAARTTRTELIGKLAGWLRSASTDEAGELRFPLSPSQVLSRDWLDGQGYERRRSEVRGAMQELMRYRHACPLMLNVLAGVLRCSSPGPREYPLHLITRAYLAAAYASERPEIAFTFRDEADIWAHYQTVFPNHPLRLTLFELEADFVRELVEARKWYEVLDADFEARIAQRGDRASLDEIAARFREAHFSEPVRITYWPEERTPPPNRTVPRALEATALIFALLMVPALWIAYRRERFARMQATAQGPSALPEPPKIWP